MQIFVASNVSLNMFSFGSIKTKMKEDKNIMKN